MIIILFEIIFGIFIFLYSLVDYIAGGKGNYFQYYALMVSITNLMIILR